MENLTKNKETTALREKLFEAEKERQNGAETYTIDEVNLFMEEIINKTDI